MEEKDWEPETLYGLDLQRFCIAGTSIRIEEFKPYLFPLSSMTEEQKKELKILCDWCDDKKDAYSILVLYQEYFIMKSDVIDWCYKNHLDINDLIPKGLALDATNKNIY